MMADQSTLKVDLITMHSCTPSGNRNQVKGDQTIIGTLQFSGQMSPRTGIQFPDDEQVLSVSRASYNIEL